jgi:single-strand DNA-binding protein
MCRRESGDTRGKHGRWILPMSLNLILLIGNAGRDAELRYTATGRAVASFSMAVSRSYQVNNEWQQETEWFNISVWGQQAENVASRVKRGAKVFAEGRLSTREYTNQAGITRTSLDVNAFRVVNLAGREDGEEGGYGSYPPATQEGQQPQGGGYSPAPQQPTTPATPATTGYGGGGGYEQPSEGDDLEDLPW